MIHKTSIHLVLPIYHQRYHQNFFLPSHLHRHFLPPFHQSALDKQFLLLLKLSCISQKQAGKQLTEMTILSQMEDLIRQKKNHVTTIDVFLMEHARSQLMMIMTMVFVALLVMDIIRLELEVNLLKKGVSLKENN